MNSQPVLSDSRSMANVPLTFNCFKTKARKGPVCRPLPEDFVPSGYSVVCGRGRACTESVGNRRLKVIANIFLAKYSKASTKEEKSAIVTSIMDILEEGCPQGPQGTFVRYSEGRWWMVDDATAREKVGALMRECLGYKSSNRVKLAMRRQRQQGSEPMQPPREEETADKPQAVAVVPSVAKSSDEAFSRFFHPVNDSDAVAGSGPVRRQSFSKQRCITSRCA